MKVTAIILSAGSGKRMNSDTKKQYIEVNNKPLIWYTLKKFQESDVNEIILVTGKEDIEYCTNIIEEASFNKVKAVIEGGKERYDSVYNGLSNCKDADYVLIHDGARPAIEVTTINRNIETVIKKSACITAVPVKDTIKRVNSNGVVVDTPKRSQMWAVQTPQSFKYDIVMEAYTKMKVEGYMDATDDSMLVERYCNIDVVVIEGTYTNIKVTTPDDLGTIASLLP